MRWPKTRAAAALVSQEEPQAERDRDDERKTARHRRNRKTGRGIVARAERWKNEHRDRHAGIDGERARDAVAEADFRHHHRRDVRARARALLFQVSDEPARPDRRGAVRDAGAEPNEERRAIEELELE